MREELFRLSQELIELNKRTFRRYFIETTTLKHRFSIVVGQRGVGKTTTLVQYLLDYVEGDHFSQKILYVPVDHFIVGNTTLFDIAEGFFQLGGEFIAFDEIHQYENWSGELKSIYDSFPALKIIASGSSALEIHKGSHDLSRRAIVYRLYGMSFREFLSLKHNISLAQYPLTDILKNHQKITHHVISELGKLKKTVLREFSDYLLCGFYPYFFELNDLALFYRTLEQNMHTTIESDLMAIYPALTGASIKKLKQLLSFIAGAVPFTPKWSDIQSLLEIGDVRTLKTYFKYLEDACLIKAVSRESEKLHKINLPEKVFIDNPNLMHAMTKDVVNIGTVREIFFIDMLQPCHEVTLHKQGDFVIDHRYTVEVGGKKKDFGQIKDLENAYLALDQIEIGFNNKIPLWLFGFLY
jgi:predicted AAA+ superfamily ATPase